MDEKILKALGEPRRYQLLQLMSCRSYCVRALAVKSGLSESAVSQHLKILREAGLVHGIKKGYYTHYRLDKDALICSHIWRNSPLPFTTTTKPAAS